MSKKSQNFSKTKKKVKTFNYNGITYNTSAFSSDDNPSSSSQSDNISQNGITTLNKLQNMTSNLNNNSHFLSSSENSNSSDSEKQSFSSSSRRR